MALLSESYRTWERETREASLLGLEGILPPPAEWPSFLDRAPASGEAEDGLGYPAPLALPDVTEELGEAAPVELEPAPPPARTAKAPGKPVPKKAETSQAGAMKELPESLLPEALRGEIEDFLNKDRPAPASEEEIDTYLKGGIDPNTDPEEES